MLLICAISNPAHGSIVGLGNELYSCFSPLISELLETFLSIGDSSLLLFAARMVTVLNYSWESNIYWFFDFYLGEGCLFPSDMGFFP